MKKICFTGKIYFTAIYFGAILCALSSKVAFTAGPDSSLRESKNNFAFKSSIIKFVDGASFGVDGQVFLLVMKNRKALRDRVYGVVGTTEVKSENKRTGMYDFDGKKCNLIDLVNIESELEKNKSRYSQEEFNAMKGALSACLEGAKEDFISTTRAYVNGVNGIKVHLLTLIEEFCNKKGIKECFLLKWGECEAGQEELIIRKEILNFKDFAQFCVDLADFLEILARSCPKGESLFNKMVEEAKKRKGA